MKKIPTLFVRKFEGHKIVDVLPQITPGCEEAFLSGEATVKIDGSCCAIINGEFYKRYDAKQGKKPPKSAIPCCDPDPITGHWPHWVAVDKYNKGDTWFTVAYANYVMKNGMPADGTYEAVGPHINANPHNLDQHILIPHGIEKITVKRDYDSIKKYLEETPIEGIVFWLNGEPVCKIKRSDFGFQWPIKEEKE